MKMKKIIPSLVAISLLAAPTLVLAQPVSAPELEVCCGSNSILYRVMNWLFAILLIVAAIFIILAAYTFVTAQGDPDKVKTARNFVLYALIGVLVAFGARGLVSLVGTVAGGTGGGGGGSWF